MTIQVEGNRQRLADRGILYAATGRRHVNEAIASLKTVRRRMPDMPVALFTDADSRPCEGLFDDTITIESPHYASRDKICALMDTPFERTLFLDTDTRLLHPVGELFPLLDRFELACAHAPWRTCGVQIPECPQSFPELNTGVVAYRRTPNVMACFERWAKLYAEMQETADGKIQDQPSFRQAVYETDVRLYVLTPEYNLRTLFSWFVGGNAKAKILHGRGPSLRRAQQTVNRGKHPRIGDARKSDGKSDDD